MKVKDNHLMIPIKDLLESLTGQDRMDLIESLACGENVILAVAELIVHGFTENGSSPGRPYDGLRSEPVTALESVRMYIADQYNAVAGDVFAQVKASEKRLAEKLQTCEEKYGKLQKAYDNFKEDAERDQQNKMYRINRLVNAIQEGIEKFSNEGDCHMVPSEVVVNALKQIKGYHCRPIQRCSW